jgi:hypothetical protein
VRRRPILIAGALAAVAAAAAWAVWPSAPPVPDWSGEYDVSARPPEAIPPGTVVGRSAPPGWSHLVIKSLPRVHPDYREKIPGLTPGLTIRMASWMFTAFLADVVREEGTNPPCHRLRAVALGLGTSINGRDVVITPETGKQFGADFGFLGAGRDILAKGYETQRKAAVPVFGPTFGLVDTPVWFRCDSKNRLVRFRYALLVDAPTGRLDVLVWSLGPDGGGCGELTEVAWLAPDTIDEAELIPDPDEFSRAGVPSEAGFAVDKLPPGRVRLLLPPDLWPLAGRTRFAADGARALEARLRQLLAP